jgi:hypothetical protein
VAARHPKWPPWVARGHPQWPRRGLQASPVPTRGGRAPPILAGGGQATSEGVASFFFFNFFIKMDMCHHLIGLM